MSRPPYRALRIVLGVLSLHSWAVGGPMHDFRQQGPLIHNGCFLRPSPRRKSQTLDALRPLKETGGFALMLKPHALLRLPRIHRPANVAIVDALIAGLGHIGSHALDFPLRVGHPQDPSELPGVGGVPWCGSNCGIPLLPEAAGEVFRTCRRVFEVWGS